ncbi:MAG: hypothetical protein PHY93_20945 [Bacteriovorax sp.]|nr:hypothetical protein [Bacteriovorax sp.]
MSHFGIEGRELDGIHTDTFVRDPYPISCCRGLSNIQYTSAEQRRRTREIYGDDFEELAKKFRLPKKEEKNSEESIGGV